MWPYSKLCLGKNLSNSLLTCPYLKLCVGLALGM